ncbi:MAG: ATP-grasp domain-containing protein [Methanomicrobiaceae archaeon]|nr:ATP-grasp domain-containing protein [Methanomicrobiaceae archaeon]
MKKKVLVAGFSTRHVARSAYNAGYEVFAVDNFCDNDLIEITKLCTSFEEIAEIPGIVDKLNEKENFDIIVSTSGAEDIITKKDICGTDPKIASFFLNKKNIQNFFESNNIPVPKIAEDGQYPVIIKPCCGAGGWKNKKAENISDENEWTKLWPGEPYIRQVPVEGIPCSVSCIADGSNARAVSFNEQFIRGGTGEKSYGFSGAVTPFNHPLEDEIIKTAETAAALSGCKGSVGIDFIAGDNKFWAIEINPRFQATMDIVELSYGINIFSAHVDACKGILPPVYEKKTEHYTARKVIFADRDITVKEDLGKLYQDIADIPQTGTSIEEGSAFLSVYGKGSTRESALESLDKTIRNIVRYISRW